MISIKLIIRGIDIIDGPLSRIIELGGFLIGEIYQYKRFG